MPEKHQPTIDFLYSLMGHAPAAWPGLRAAGIPAAVQEWAAQDAARQQDLATVWADVCREQPYAEDEDMVSYTLDFFGPDVDYGWSPLVASAIWLTDNYTEGADYPELERVGMAIVRLLLENYGFAVTDLGKDVEPERIVEAAVKLHAPLVGLSALMTTTVPAMEETIRQLRKAAPWCKIVVGGAVLNQEYADSIGADKYAGDAMETVRYAEELWKAL